jgi:lysozyme family protein
MQPLDRTWVEFGHIRDRHSQCTGAIGKQTLAALHRRHAQIDRIRRSVRLQGARAFDQVRTLP